VRTIAAPLALAALLALAACSSGAESRCPDLCAREAKCAEELDDEQIKLDRSECSQACQKLDRTGRGRALVDEQMACLAGASTCPAILACALDAYSGSAQ
jgi:hypothetical protein